MIRTEKRNRLQEYLKENDIQTLIHYPIPIHKQQAYVEFHNLSLPITEKIHNEVLSLPLSPIIIKKDIDRVIKILNKY